MNKIVLKRNKAQVSLEYLLIFIGLLTIFSLFISTTYSIYNKNLTYTNNKRIDNLCKNIQETINLQELQGNTAKQIINIKNINFEDIEINQKSKKELLIINKSNNREYLITTSLNFVIDENINLENKKEIIIIKKGNIITISLK